MYGRQFQTTWNGRKTANGSILYAFDAIESILRHECGALDADINMTSFDNMRQINQGGLWQGINWMIASQIHEPIDALDVIERICYLFGFLYYTDNEGKHALVGLQFNSPVRTLTIDDFKEPQKNLRITMTKPENIVSDITMRSGKNFFEDDEFKGTYHANGTSANYSLETYFKNKLAAAKAELGGIDQCLAIDNEWISQSRYWLAMRWFIEWRYRSRMILDGDIWMDNLDLEIGQQVVLDLPSEYLASPSCATSHFVLVEKRVKDTSNTIGVRFLEVPFGYYGDEPD
jgi:hypothetical protein